MKFTSEPLLPLAGKIKSRHLKLVFKALKPLPLYRPSMLQLYHTNYPAGCLAW